MLRAMVVFSPALSLSRLQVTPPGLLGRYACRAQTEIDFVQQQANTIDRGERELNRVICLAGDDESLDALTFLSHFFLDPTDVAQNLPYSLITRLAALQFDDEPPRIRPVPSTTGAASGPPGPAGRIPASYCPRCTGSPC